MSSVQTASLCPLCGRKGPSARTTRVRLRQAGQGCGRTCSLRRNHCRPDHGDPLGGNAQPAVALGFALAQGDEPRALAPQPAVQPTRPAQCRQYAGQQHAALARAAGQPQSAQRRAPRRESRRGDILATAGSGPGTAPGRMLFASPAGPRPNPPAEAAPPRASNRPGRPGASRIGPRADARRAGRAGGRDLRKPGRE